MNEKKNLRFKETKAKKYDEKLKKQQTKIIGNTVNKPERQ